MTNVKILIERAYSKIHSESGENIKANINSMVNSAIMSALHDDVWSVIINGVGNPTRDNCKNRLS